MCEGPSVPICIFQKFKKNPTYPSAKTESNLKYSLFDIYCFEVDDEKTFSNNDDFVLTRNI